MDVQERYSHFTWLLDNLLPSKLRLPPAKAGKVMSSHPPLSLPCCGWKVAVTITDPSLVQGHLQVLLLQESSQGDLDHCKGSVGGTGGIKEVKDAVQSAVFWSCWKVPVSLKGWSQLRKAGFKQTSHLLPSAGKSQRGIFNVLKSEAKGKTFF